eukprot:TRINITY_DN364_c0_g1_i2.p1 TRINITY_DN364_c0_g1~~TRINITY_DN364_c0_g1_i2.p1  ORF type:complete len:225 (-),score=43.72 TRINITY_DN364_c0_g1_i2:651-1325(-)
MTTIDHLCFYSSEAVNSRLDTNFLLTEPPDHILFTNSLDIQYYSQFNGQLDHKHAQTLTITTTPNLGREEVEPEPDVAEKLNASELKDKKDDKISPNSPTPQIKSILKNSSSSPSKNNHVVLGASVEDTPNRDRRLIRTGTKYIRKEDFDEEIGVIQKKQQIKKGGSLKLRTEKNAWVAAAAELDEAQGIKPRQRSQSMNLSQSSDKKKKKSPCLMRRDGCIIS